jgi:hypothetical protein
MPILSRVPEKIQIEIKLNYLDENRDKPFNLPEKVEVKQGTIIQWVIKDLHRLEELFFKNRRLNSGLKFTLYFDDNSPFEWQNESSFILTDFPHFHPNIKEPLIIASGNAQKKGDFKYGLKLFNLKNQDEPEYDEDPYLSIY